MQSCGLKVTKLIDTNIVVRFLVRDNEAQYSRVIEWFKQAESGQLELVLESVVVAETCFVLESFYKVKRANIADSMKTLLSQKWLKVPSRQALLSMWSDYESGLHFVDCFLIALSVSHRGGVLTFDKQIEQKISLTHAN